MISIGWPIFFVVVLVFSIGSLRFLKKNEFIWIPKLIWKVSIPSIIISFALSCTVTVKPGHSGVAKLFGSVQTVSQGPGLHFANPFLDWVQYDCREKTHKEIALVPSMDQLMTRFDISVQYKLNSKMTPKILNETGTAVEMLNVHLIPKFRSIIRELGKTVPNAEDFFKTETQARLQSSILTALQNYMSPKGMVVLAVLIRNMTLPKTIVEGVEAKKQRDQEAEKEKSELKRFKTELQKKVETASAELKAARKQAEQKRVLADAHAYEIKKINEAIAQNPAYIKLEGLKTLKGMAKDPATKIYFLNGNSPNPIPLMHMGEGLNTPKK
jgi:regulator of protease activity HflC (stomatin/prohibitin superfamily)